MELQEKKILVVGLARTGVALTTFLARAGARVKGIPVWGELELAGQFITRPIIAVSGTNGKTTTTTLVGRFLEASGLRPLVGGNIGTPLISLLSRQQEADYLVREVSGFKLHP